MFGKEAEILTELSSNGLTMLSPRTGNMWSLKGQYLVVYSGPCHIYFSLTIHIDLIIPRGIENKTAIGKNHFL